MERKVMAVVVIGAVFILFKIPVVVISLIIALIITRNVMEENADKMVTLQGMRAGLQKTTVYNSELSIIRRNLISQIDVFENFKKQLPEISYGALSTTTPAEPMKDIIRRAEPEFKKTCNRIYNLVLIDCKNSKFGHRVEAERLLDENSKLLDDMGEALFGVASLNTRHSTEYVADYASALREAGR